MKIEVMQQVLDAEFNRGYKEGVRDAYAIPAQRPWVGLTEEEIAAFDWNHAVVDAECVRAIEAKLKEKNNAT